jgi:nitrate reductase gamma subunit
MTSENMNEIAQAKRPKMVWVISAWYILSVSVMMISHLTILAGLVPVRDEQRSYFESLTVLDHLITFLCGSLTLAAAVSLFFLRRLAVKLFAISLALSIAFSLFLTLRRELFGAVGGSGLFGAIIGWLIMGAVCLYAWGLEKKGILT